MSWRLIALVAVLAVFALVGVEACATRLHGGVYDDDGGLSDPDLAFVVKPDLFTPVVDLAVPPKPDLAVPGKTCGEIMRCILACGAMLGGCQTTCFQGASPEGFQQAGAVVACIVPNCILNQPDGGGQGDILLCVFSKCQTQLSMCKGFGF